MASSKSSWTTIAANTGSPPSVTENVSIAQSGTNASGINGYVRHECLMWLDGTDPIYTDNFNWAINGNFTVICNATLNSLDDDAGNVDVDIEGSVDGTNYVKLADLITWNAGGGSETEIIGSGIYDYETKGVMPYMRLALDCQSDSDSVALDENIKLNVFMHSNT